MQNKLKNKELFLSLYYDKYEDFVKKIFENKKNINIFNENNESLLHYCCFYGMIDKYYALINFGAKKILTKKGNSLLHYASFGGNDEFLIIDLTKSGFKGTDKNFKGETSLHMAKTEKTAHYFNIWCMRNKIDIKNLIANNGNTVAHSCFAYGFIDSANYWIKNFPELKTIKNKKNQIWNEVTLKNENFCLNIKESI